jgi:hypothetical protein
VLDKDGDMCYNAGNHLTSLLKLDDKKRL